MSLIWSMITPYLYHLQTVPPRLFTKGEMSGSVGIESILNGISTSQDTQVEAPGGMEGLHGTAAARSDLMR